MRIKTSTAFAALAVLALAGCEAKDNVTDAKLDANDVWRLVAIHFVDSSSAPEVTFDGVSYVVDGEEVEARIINPEIDFASSAPDDWCVVIHYNGGKDAVHVGAEGGPEAGEDC